MKENHPQLAELAKQDQLDRTKYFAGELSESNLHERDKKRLAQVTQLIKDGVAKTYTDYEHAAIVFQHGRSANNERDPYASGMAVKMMRKALELNSGGNRWLLAAAIDRDLMIRGFPQIYGTQFTRDHEQAPWIQYEIDPTQVNDEERKHHFVPSLTKQKEQLLFMNKKGLLKLYQSSGLEVILDYAKKGEVKTAEYNISQEGINSLAYQLIKLDQPKDAVKVFELNTKLYPEEFDTFHGLGDGYFRIGQHQEAIIAFEQCLLLNPDFELAKTDLVKAKKALL